jgi:tetratricopeptide (TPR) repeat protein
MGGSGKTQLAFRCCQKAREIGFAATLWINASSSSTVIQSYRSILNRISPGYERLNSEGEAVSKAHNVIERWTGRWLIVFDNYDNPGAFASRTIREYIPIGKEGRVLFASRHEDSSRLGHSVNLSRMTENESVELLLQRPASTLQERSEGVEVATTLGYLGLALDQAGAYIRSRELPLNQFVEHYKRRKKIVLEEIPDEWEYRRKREDSDIELRLSVFTTWEMSLDLIKGSPKEREQKIHFLTLTAFLNPQYISERYFQAYSTIDGIEWIKFLMNGKKWDSDKLGDLLAEFRRLSLLQVLDRRKNEHAFSIHPLICDWMKFRKCVEAPSRITELTSMLAAFLEAHNSNDLPLEVNQETTRHVDAWVEANENILQDSYKTVLTMPRKSIGLFAGLYRVQGRYKKAERLYQRALEEWEEKLGPKHPETLRTVHNLAVVYWSQGLYGEAEKLYQRALEGWEEKLGPKHPETLLTIQNLGLVYWNQGRYEEAEKLSRQALKGLEEKLGLGHRETLLTVQNLAIVYRIQGRYEEAEKLYHRALEGWEEKLGPKHPETLRTTYNLALVYWNQGCYEEAETLNQRALKGLEEKLGANHPQTLRTVQNLANVYRDQGRYEEAEQLSRRALKGKEEKLGANHPETLETVDNLALIYRDQDRYEEAEQLSRRALTGKEKKLGPKHPETLETVGNLALVCRDQGRYEEAEQLTQRALTGKEEKLGAKHPETLKTVDNLALVCRDQSRYEEAEQLSRRALAGKEEKLGVKHPETLKTVYNLARVCVNQSRYEEAEQLYRRALAGRDEKLGGKHPDTLRTVHGLANVYRGQGRYEDAEQLYRP